MQEYPGATPTRSYADYVFMFRTGCAFERGLAGANGLLRKAQASLLFPLALSVAWVSSAVCDCGQLPSRPGRHVKSLLRAATQPASSALSHPILVAFGRSPHRRRDRRSHHRVWLGFPPGCSRNAYLADQASCPPQHRIDLFLAPCDSSERRVQIALLPHPPPANRRPGTFPPGPTRGRPLCLFVVPFPSPFVFFLSWP